MFNIKCNKCGSNIVLDHQRTTNSYISTMDYIVDKNGVLDINTIQEYMYYKCSICNSTYKYTIKDIEREVRKSFAETAMSLKRDEVFNNHKVNEDSVIKYCGKCRGQDGKGNCFPVIMNNCPIRNKF